MKSLWNDATAQQYSQDPLQLRVYTSRLLGQSSNLVLHGGGNTSVKATTPNLFGEPESLLYVKGSGWDLATIEAAGFSPVRMDVLLKMAELETLSDTAMVQNQRAAMTNPNAPNPSVEAILHALIPFTYVDHTHADAVVSITNTPNGEDRIREIYGPNVLIVPYVMPGFILARTIYEMTQELDWQELEGMILMNHGVFTFANEAKESYEQMIKLVSMAEAYITNQGVKITAPSTTPQEDLLQLATIRQKVSQIQGRPVVAQLDTTDESIHFSTLPNLKTIAKRGPLTPDHVIRTKRIPAILTDNPTADLEEYVHEYQTYFEEYNDGQLTCLDPAPRWAVWPEYGTLAFGRTLKEAQIITDIKAHTMQAIQTAEALGGWQALPAKDIFEVEYWELEQAKLRKGGQPPVFQGKVALVTGAASGIGKACVEAFHAQGAIVVALDINPEITTLFTASTILGLVCDVTDRQNVADAVAETVRRFGGLDILVNNAGLFPTSERIAEMTANHWEHSLAVNLTGQQIMLQTCAPYLCVGIDPAVVVIASKNVPAPGPGAGAYSVAKAGATQLSRIAALELAEKGVRVNMLHPNGVFDTALWTPDLLSARATHYEVDVDTYKRNNLLKVEVTSQDVANLACTLAGPVFAKTTGAQIPIDGGNERVI